MFSYYPIYTTFFKEFRGFYPNLGQLFPFWDKAEGQKSNILHKTLHGLKPKKAQNEGISRQNTFSLTWKG